MNIVSQTLKLCQKGIVSHGTEQLILNMIGVK